MPLPENYTQLLYIESNGTQYINTGFMPNRNTRIVLDVEGFGAKVEYLYGVEGYKIDFCLCKTSASAAYATGYYFGGSVRITPTNIRGRNIVDQNANVFSVDTVVGTANVSSSYTECGYPLYLFNVYSADKQGITNYGASVKLYSCRIYDNGTLVRDFIPCENDSGTVGLYDIANNTFYPDASGAGFVAGQLPDYKIVDANQLNGALSATANAIRAKTCETTPIAWDAASGFASAINDIQINPTLQEKSVTPSDSVQNVTPDSGYDGLSKVTVKGDANLIPENIKEGVSIFGVDGSLAAGAKVATGTFTASYGYSYYILNDHPLTISGIGFKPSRVIAYSAGGNGAAAAPTLAIFDVGTESVFLELGSRKLTEGTNYAVSLNEDGFTLSALNAESTAYIMYNTWNYIAIG